MTLNPSPAEVEMGGYGARPKGLRVAALVATETVSGAGRQLAALAREVSEVGIEFLVVLFHRRGRPT